MTEKETYYSKNKERVLEYQRKRYPKIKNKMKEYNRDYYKEHKPLIELNKRLKTMSKKLILLESKIDSLSTAKSNTMIVNIVKTNNIQRQPTIKEEIDSNEQLTKDNFTIVFD
jgi:uncharacterized coiled-coil DUF342 family protein